MTRIIIIIKSFRLAVRWTHLWRVGHDVFNQLVSYRLESTATRHKREPVNHFPSSSITHTHTHTHTRARIPLTLTPIQSTDWNNLISFSLRLTQHQRFRDSIASLSITLVGIRSDNNNNNNNKEMNIKIRQHGGLGRVQTIIPSR